MNLTQAACRGHDPELWFADDRHRADGARALVICRTSCPIRQACLNWAMAFEAASGNTNRSGIFGGLTSLQRRRLANGTPRRRAPEQHGSPVGYRQHGRNGSLVCPACLAAMAEVRRAARAKKTAA